MIRSFVSQVLLGQSCVFNRILSTSQIIKSALKTQTVLGTALNLIYKMQSIINSRNNKIDYFTSELYKKFSFLIYQQLIHLYSLFYTIPMRPRIIKDPFSLPKIQSRSTSRSSTNNFIAQIQNKLTLPLIDTNTRSSESSFKQIKTAPINTNQRKSEKRMSSEDRYLKRKLPFQYWGVKQNILENDQAQVKKKNAKNEKNKLNRKETLYQEKYNELKTIRARKYSKTDFQNLRLVGQMKNTPKSHQPTQKFIQDNIFANSSSNLSIILKKQVSQEQSLRDIDEYLRIMC